MEQFRGLSDGDKILVRNGGGFYGICGDSTFGSLGVIKLPGGYRFSFEEGYEFLEFHSDARYRKCLY